MCMCVFVWVCVCVLYGLQGVEEVYEEYKNDLLFKDVKLYA